MQADSIKAARKRKDLLDRAARQEKLYRSRLAKGDRAGAIKALKTRDELMQKARYAAYRMSKYTP